MKVDQPTNAIVTFFCLWDEKKGPKIIDSFPNCEFDLEAIALQILPVFQSVFGNRGNIQYDRTSLLLPMKNQKKLAKILLNSKPDPEIRGGFLPIVSVLLFPIELSSEYTHYYTIIQDMMITTYSTQNTIKLEEYKEELKEKTYWGAQDLYHQAIGAKKAKKYSYAAELFENASILARIGGIKEIFRNASSEMDKSRMMAAQEIIEDTQHIIKNQRIDQATVMLDRALTMASATGNNKIIKKTQQGLDNRLFEIINIMYLDLLESEKGGERTLFKEAERKLLHINEIVESRGTAIVQREMRTKTQQSYTRWATSFFNRGVEEIKTNQLSLANRSLTNALKFAQKTNDEKLIIKIQDQLVKVPNP